jgi:thiamine pyrophosphate-dependent acetolactate synthase large subunit-like protein
VLVETLQAADVKTCHGIVGHTLNRIAHAIGRSRSIGSTCAMKRPEAVVGMAVYTARAMLQGKGHDVWEMMVDNFP